ncbi:MAG: ABC transporter substrate-binding protein [Rhodospirillales bacterium]|nr:ABC transporter substrate-binding protein [Rhodospirillales bacterium]
MKPLILTLLILFITLPVHAADNESVYDRVMKSGTIRCGYAMWPGHLNKDPNTGEMSGVFYDYMETLARNLNLKIEWAEEIGWGDMVAALKFNRIDAYCVTTAYNAERAREVDFLSPLFYMPSDLFVQADDTRFDYHPEKLNDPAITMTIVEGDIYNKITDRNFPQAQTLDLPQLASMAELYMTVADGKADATLSEVSGALEFMAANPGKIRRVKLEKPFQAMPVSIPVKGGEYRFQRMLDIATIEMLNNSTFEAILKKYEKYPGTFLRIQPDYEVAQ